MHCIQHHIMRFYSNLHRWTLMTFTTTLLLTTGNKPSPSPPPSLDPSKVTWAKFGVVFSLFVGTKSSPPQCHSGFLVKHWCCSGDQSHACVLREAWNQQIAVESGSYLQVFFVWSALKFCEKGNNFEYWMYLQCTNQNLHAKKSSKKTVWVKLVGKPQTWILTYRKGR